MRLATGCSWEDAERLCGNKVSDTTVRERRGEWLATGVFDAIANEAIAACDRVIGPMPGRRVARFDQVAAGSAIGA